MICYIFLQKRSQTPHATQNIRQDCATKTDDDEVDDEICTHCKQYGHDIVTCGNEYISDDGEVSDYLSHIKKVISEKLAMCLCFGLFTL